jgi:hypothetical protein
MFRFRGRIVLGAGSVVLGAWRLETGDNVVRGCGQRCSIAVGVQNVQNFNVLHLQTLRHDSIFSHLLEKKRHWGSARMDTVHILTWTTYSPILPGGGIRDDGTSANLEVLLYVGFSTPRRTIIDLKKKKRRQI